MPTSQISNFPSKLNCSLFTMSVQQVPHFVPTLAPSFPSVLSSNQSQGHQLCVCTGLSPSLPPSFPKAITLIQVLILLHSDHIVQILFILCIIFESLMCTGHLLGTRNIAGNKWDSSRALMGIISYCRERKQRRGMMKGIKRKNSHACLLDSTEQDLYHHLNPLVF